MQKKQVQLLYRSTTYLLSFFMVMSGVMYFVSPEVAANFSKVGFPQFFRIELGIAKILGALVLVLPRVPEQVKEWAYAGFGITFLSAAVAHVSAGEPIATAVPPLVFFGLLAASYIFRQKMDVPLVTPRHV